MYGFMLIATDVAFGEKGVSPFGQPLQTNDVVLDAGDRLLVGQTRVFELLLVGLQLGD